MPNAQIFGYTPPNPPIGQPGYVAAHARSGGGVVLTVREAGQADPGVAALEMPLAEAEALALAILEAAATDAGDPAAEPLLRWFAWGHLPANLQAVSRPLGVLAHRLARVLPRSAERSVALRKLLEAKDAAVRAALEPGA